METKLYDKIRINSFIIYEHYLKERYPFGRVIPSKNISNPFISHKQETPSFNIYRSYDGGYVFHDFATGDKGNVITFVQKMEKVDKNLAIQIIKNKILWA